MAPSLPSYTIASNANHSGSALLQQHYAFRKQRSLAGLAAWAADMAALGLSFAACFYFVFWHTDIYLRYQVALLITLLTATVAFHISGLYDAHPAPSRLTMIRKLMLANGAVFTSLVMLGFVTKTSEDYSRQWWVTWLASSTLALVVLRGLLTRVLGNTLRRLDNPPRAILVGTLEEVRRTMHQLREGTDNYLDVTGYFADDGDSADRLWLGPASHAVEHIKQHPIDQVWLTCSLTRFHQLEGTIAGLKDVIPDIRLVPYLPQIRSLNHSLEVVAGLPVLNISTSPINGINRLVKAIEDRVLAALILLLCSPLLLAIAIAVKLSSPGPVFYRQERMSWNGQRFYILKFRTMPVDAEAASGPVWSGKGDNRATRIGQFLRNTSMDELPQFWNVFVGDMSIVGPRPERPVFIEKFKDGIDGYMLKHKVKAGITGWAQVNGWRGDTDLQQRIEHDLHYIEGWSLLLDIEIILATVWQVIVKRLVK